MKIRPVGAELFHADGQTDIMNLVVAFCNFANAPNNWQMLMLIHYYYYYYYYMFNWNPQWTLISYINDINKFGFVIETKCVFCATGTEFLNVEWISGSKAFTSNIFGAVRMLQPLKNANETGGLKHNLTSVLLHRIVCQLKKNLLKLLATSRIGRSVTKKTKISKHLQSWIDTQK
jgi:hypothetical protein